MKTLIPFLALFLVLGCEDNENKILVGKYQEKLKVG